MKICDGARKRRADLFYRSKICSLTIQTHEEFLFLVNGFFLLFTLCELSLSEHFFLWQLFSTLEFLLTPQFERSIHFQRQNWRCGADFEPYTFNRTLLSFLIHLDLVLAHCHNNNHWRFSPRAFGAWHKEHRNCTATKPQRLYKATELFCVRLFFCCVIV